MAQINRPTDYFNTKLYTGDGNSSQAITGVNFQPDLVWLKNRSDSTWHQLIDAVRGTGSANTLASNSNEGDGGGATNLYGFISAIGSDGFTVSAGTTNASVVNHNGNNYASWNWLASNTTASNTDGSITSTVSASTVSGFSIVSYTGTGANATVGHGLGVAPSMIIVKRRDTANDWLVYHKTLTATDYLNLNDAGATASATAVWNNTEPTSSVFTVGTGSGVNASSGTFVGYCFAEKKGFSKFGSYTGNGSTDGTFVYTGFKPAWVMIKRTDAIQQWGIMDNKRNTFNPMNAPLFAESTQAESSSAFNNFDILSNGIKMKTGDQWTNASGGTYIYMAFAENPLVGTNNIPSVAR
jgi:hypothetical protein